MAPYDPKIKTRKDILDEIDYRIQIEMQDGVQLMTENQKNTVRVLSDLENWIQQNWL